MRKYIGIILIGILGLLIIGCTQPIEPLNNETSNTTNNTITLEYFYGECKDPNNTYCTQMNPIINELKQEFANDIEIKSINLTERHTNQDIMDLESKYKNKNMLPGIPTYIINEKYYTAGAMSKTQLKDWICTVMNDINKTIDECN